VLIVFDCFQLHVIFLWLLLSLFWRSTDHLSAVAQQRASYLLREESTMEPSAMRASTSGSKKAPPASKSSSNKAAESDYLRQSVDSSDSKGPSPAVSRSWDRGSLVSNVRASAERLRSSTDAAAGAPVPQAAAAAAPVPVPGSSSKKALGSGSISSGGGGKRRPSEGSTSGAPVGGAGGGANTGTSSLRSSINSSSMHNTIGMPDEDISEIDKRIQALQSYLDNAR
jgi:hypothetical protein